jgi:capsular polysaccharide biosynthesis protein
MQTTNDININKDLEDEISLKEIIDVLLRSKLIIIFITLSFSIGGVLYSLSLPNIYESKAILVSSSPENKPSLLQNYSGLANLAGIDVSKSYEANAEQALEKINSLSFFEHHFMPNIFLPDLMAFKKWDAKSNLAKYNKDVYDIDSNKWIRGYSFPNKLIPSAQESYNIFKEKHLSIAKDKNTNLVTVKVRHQSPHIAKEWTALVIDEINSFYRKKDRSEAEKAVNYLNSLLATTKLSEINENLATLLQQEIQKLTLIEANEFYVFEYIDPPAIMEKKSEPSRALICIIVSLFGAMLSILFALVKNYLFSNKLNP